MGSVSDDFMCPWCGRVGAGGSFRWQAAKPGRWVYYPICTAGAHSCLKAADGGKDLQAFRVAQLAVIFVRPHPVMTPDALREIASCLGPFYLEKKWVHFDPSFGWLQRFLNSTLLHLQLPQVVVRSGWLERFLNSTRQQCVQERLAFDLSTDELAVFRRPSGTVDSI
jgi:hypothetical protein